MNRRRAMYGEMIQASGQVAEFLFAVATRDFEKLNEEALTRGSLYKRQSAYLSIGVRSLSVTWSGNVS